MKNLLIFLSLFFLMSVAQAEVTPKIKAILFKAIAENVYFEDDGLIRAPEKLEDFAFEQVQKSLFEINGDSYSAWDGKVIGYRCIARSLRKTGIKSTQDIEMSCTLIDENWPHL